MTIENLVYTLAGMAVGLAIGLALSVRWQKREDGTDVLRVSLSSRWQRMFFVIVGVMAVFSVSVTAVQNRATSDQTDRVAAVTRIQQQQVARQTYCNQELIRVINTNAQLTAADRANLAGLLASIGQEVLNPDPDPDTRRAVVQEAFRKYRDTDAANTAARQPYPPPDCGK